MTNPIPERSSAPFRLKRVSLVFLTAFLFFLFNRSLPAGGPDSAVQETPNFGRDYAGLCGACHGERGISNNSMVPSLAGQDRSYLVGQLRAFRDQRRHHAAMEGVLSKLTEDDMTYMVAYYAKQRPMAGKGPSRKIKKGEPLYDGCKGCHGGRAGGGEGIPRLAGQKAAYLEGELLDYQTGIRSTAGMNEAVARLTLKEIEALSRYLSSLK